MEVSSVTDGRPCRRSRFSASRSDALGEGDGEAGVEHRCRHGGCDGVRGGVDEVVGTGTVDQEHQARTGAELADTGVHRGDVGGAELGAAVGERTGKHEDRVDARHLGVDRDRNRTGRGGGGQRQTALPGTGEADRTDAGVGDQRDADVRPDPKISENVPSGRPWVCTAVADGTADQFGGTRVRRVRLDDHRGAGGQRGGGVAAGDGEGEREVTGREHRDRAERDLRVDAGRVWVAGCGRGRRCPGGRRSSRLPARRRRTSAVAPVVRAVSP